MRIQCTTLTFGREIAEPQIMQQVNETLAEYGSDDWSLVNAVQHWYGDALEFWLYFQKAD